MEIRYCEEMENFEKFKILTSNEKIALYYNFLYISSCMTRPLKAVNSLSEMTFEDYSIIIGEYKI